MKASSAHPLAGVPDLAALGFGVLLVAAWLNPTHYLPWTGFYSELPATAGILILACAVTWRFRRSRIQVPVSAMVFVAIATIPVGQWVLGLFDYVGDARLCSLYLAGTAVCLCVGATTTLGDEQFTLTDALAWTFVAGAIASTGIALQQWFGLATWSEWIVEGQAGMRADANLGQANHMATLLLWAMLAAAYLRTRGQLSAPTLGLTSSFLVLGLALTQSRTTWLAVLVLSAWATLRRRALWEPLQLRAQMVVCLVPLYLALVWADLTLPATLRLLDMTPSADGRLQAGLRPLLWEQMVEAIRMSPWFGYGWLQGQTAQASAAISVPGLEYSSYSHNLVLDLIVWNGLPLGLLLSATLAWWYFRLGLRAQGSADFFRFGVLTAFAVHSMLEYPFAYTYLLIPVALLAGQLEAREAPHITSPRWARFSRVSFALCSSVCAALTFAIARDYVLAEADRREVQMVLVRIGGVRPFPPVPDLWVLDQLRAASRGARIDVKPAMPQAEIDELLKVTRRYPGAFFLRTAAAALALNGREEEALVELHRLRGLHGERQYQAGIAWLNETAGAKAWPIGKFLTKVAASR